MRLRFQLPEPARSRPGNRPSTVSDRATVAEALAAHPAGPRWTADELSALNQFMTAAAEARDVAELGRAAVQSLFYQTGAALAGLFTLDPSDPVPKVIWPEAAQVDDHLARQLTRRVHRDHRLGLAGRGHGLHPADDDRDDRRAVRRRPGPAGQGRAEGVRGPAPVQDRRVLLGAGPQVRRGGGRVRRPAVARARARRVLEAEVARLKAAAPDADELVGDSPAMVALRAELVRAAAGPRPVLFRGEPGAGKELAAREAHRKGPRADGPFVAVRAGAAPTGLLESELFGYRKGAFSGADKDHPGLVAQADDGTLYFDEVADLPPTARPGCSRLIERRAYRPVGATVRQPGGREGDGGDPARTWRPRSGPGGSGPSWRPPCGRPR